MHFFTDDISSGKNWRGFERAVARLMSHLGWNNVTVIGGSKDQGGDILATRREQDGSTKSWVVQCKAITGSNYVGVAALNEVVHALSKYNVQVEVVATNGEFTKSAKSRKDDLIANGFDTRLWNGATLVALVERSPLYAVGKRQLREYQSRIVQKVLAKYDSGSKRAFYIVATGLGKTVIAAEIAQELWNRGLKKILVLCHATDLALQLEQGFWSMLSKEIPTVVFFNGLPPALSDGISFGLYQSLAGYLGGFDSTHFDAIIVDEAHHALANGFRLCLDNFHPKFLVGMTATPWRRDGKNIADIFGEAVDRVSLVDGMAMGYLAKVDYRIFCDNVNWQEVGKLSKKKVSISDLNKRLFLPQRDDAVIAEIKKVISTMRKPRIAVFSPSLVHAEQFANLLSANGVPCTSLSCSDKVERRRRLLAFSTGQYSAVTAVDVMNEGIDVPDVNVLVFLRATHSRRIFVQQLGRGLRIDETKDKVIVLDFVSDIRRMAEMIELNNEGKTKGQKYEVVYLKDGFVSFFGKEIKRFVEAWLEDVADLADASEDAKLTFPEGL